MATIANIINLVGCGLSQAYGTGSQGCDAFLKEVKSLWLTPRGFKFDSAEVLNETYAQELQAAGNLIVLKGIYAFTDNSEETVVETSDYGIDQVVRKGKYKFMVEFINGLYYQAALNSLNSFENYDVLMVDADNNILGTLDSDGSLKGFSTGMIQVAKYTFGTGSTAQKQGLSFQLTDPDELDSDFAFVSGKSLAPFKPKNLDGINEVVLSFNTAPADAATSLVVKAVLKQGGGAFSGAAVGNFLLKVDGVTSNPTVATEVAGVYTLTVSALSTNEVLALSLYNVATSVPTIELDNVLYKSNTLTATVV